MLTVLHISDVHFGMKDLPGEFPLLAEPLIAAAHADGLRPDLCIFSGDLAHTGSPDQFSASGKWLRRLVSPWDCPLFIVPGNHDVCRPQTTPKLFRSTASSLDQYSEWRNSAIRATPHLSDFFNWHRASIGDLRLRSDWSSPFGFRYCSAVDKMMVHIIGLNTALFCCNDEDDGNLVADINFLNEKLSEINAHDECVIVVMHHPVDSLTPWNRDLLKQRFAQDRGAHLLLHGHIHDPSSVAIADSTGRSLATLAAGAAFQDSPYPKFFSFYQIDFDYPIIETRTYGYSSNSGEWAVDPGLSGKVVARLPRRPSVVSDHRSTLPPRSTVPHSPPMLTNLTPTQIDVDGRRYREAARDAEKRILTFFSQADEISDYIYAIKSRVKSLDSIKRKYKSRSDSKIPYDLANMADICGLRIVTFYQSNIPNILSYLLHIIRRVADRHVSPFRQNCDVEIDINTSRPDNDPLSLIKPIRRVIADAGLNIDAPLISRETGYSSVHVVVTVLLIPEVDGIGELKVEIQIRSALEDIWGEIDHRLRYGSKRGELGQAWSHHLNVFKGIVDSLAQYLDLIKSHSEEEPAKPPSDLSALRSAAQPRAQVEMLRGLGLPEKAAERLEAAYSLWKSADSTLERGGQPGLLRQAADEFLALRSECPSLADEKLAAEFDYVVTAEAAYLLTYTGVERDLLEALGLYEGILRKRPMDALVHFRIGNVYRQLGNLPSSLDHLLKALAIIESGADSKINRRHWVYDEARLGLGLTEWRRFYDPLLSQDARNDAMRAARSSALAVLEHPAENSPSTRVRAGNAYLYYLYECKEKNLIDDDDKTKVDAYLIELMETIKNGHSLSIQTRINYIDTALRFTRDNCAISLSLVEKLEEDIERLHLARFPDARLESRGSAGWLIEISRFLDDENRDSLVYAKNVVERCRSAR